MAPELLGRSRAPLRSKSLLGRYEVAAVVVTYPRLDSAANPTPNAPPIDRHREKADAQTAPQGAADGSPPVAAIVIARPLPPRRPATPPAALPDDPEMQG